MTRYKHTGYRYRLTLHFCHVFNILTLNTELSIILLTHMSSMWTIILFSVLCNLLIHHTTLTVIDMYSLMIYVSISVIHCAVPSWPSILIKHESCLFVHVIRSHQKSQLHEILALGLIWANLKTWQSPIFEIFKGGPHMVQC